MVLAAALASAGVGASDFVASGGEGPLLVGVTSPITTAAAVGFPVAAVAMGLGSRAEEEVGVGVVGADVLGGCVVGCAGPAVGVGVALPVAFAGGPFCCAGLFGAVEESGGVTAELVEEGTEAEATLIGVGRRDMGVELAAATGTGVPHAELEANKGEDDEEESVRMRTGPEEAVESVRESEREGGSEEEESVRPRGSKLVAIAPAKSKGGTCSRARIQSS